MAFDSVEDWPEAVVIFSSRDDIVAGYFPHLRLSEGPAPHEVHWREGFHDRCFLLAERLPATRGGFRFRDVDGETHELVPMTLARYRKHVRHKTIGRPEFDSLSELLEAMRREW